MSKPYTRNLPIVNIRIHPLLKKDIEAAAERDGMSINEWLNLIVRDAIERGVSIKKVITTEQKPPSE